MKGTFSQTQTILDKLLEQERKAPSVNFLHQPHGTSVRTYTWGDAADRVRRISYALIRQGFEPGSRIGILAKNSANWFMTDLAIMLAGYISVPIFSMAGKDTIQYICKHADLKMMFVGTLDNTDSQVSAIRRETTIIGMDSNSDIVDRSLDGFISHERYNSMPKYLPDSVCTIIYTSGSTGTPKGVEHTFESLNWAANELVKKLSVTSSDRFISYLPLAHVAERALIQHVSILGAAQVWFVESTDTFQRDINRCKPTLFLSVPRLWMKFQQQILSRFSQKKLNVLFKVPVLRSMIKQKIRSELGLDHVRICASGTAPLSVALIDWFNKLGLQISEGWGMTENCAYGTNNIPFVASKVGSIGTPLVGIELKLSEEQEILVKGPCLMKGYYRQEKETRSAFTSDGFFKTGDKGEIDSDGYVRITGRLKDIFKTSKGKYISPAMIENKMQSHWLIEQVCVVGSGLPQPVALVVLSEDANPLTQKEIVEALTEVKSNVNDSLESHQKLDLILVCAEQWSVENGLMTPTMKVKREGIESKYGQHVIQQQKENVAFIYTTSE